MLRIHNFKIFLAICMFSSIAAAAFAMENPALQAMSTQQQGPQESIDETTLLIKGFAYYLANNNFAYSQTDAYEQLKEIFSFCQQDNPHINNVVFYTYLYLRKYLAILSQTPEGKFLIIFFVEQNPNMFNYHLLQLSFLAYQTLTNMSFDVKKHKRALKFATTIDSRVDAFDSRLTHDISVMAHLLAPHVNIDELKDEFIDTACPSTNTSSIEPFLYDDQYPYGNIPEHRKTLMTWGYQFNARCNHGLFSQ